MDHIPGGKHVLLDMTGLPEGRLNAPGFLQETMRAALMGEGATILQEVVHRFEPQGVTVVFVLAESHASLHTYPEHGALMADFFTCGDVCPLAICARFREAISQGVDHTKVHANVSLLHRGQR
jgi:S-adenosylmethionine decarboxylase